ncbi:MAG: hypothetical protein JW832_16120 [Deltaproteobacteria bacterium]|nr:hypothetical protein [Deltaproteobacteria bacterium]
MNLRLTGIVIGFCSALTACCWGYAVVAPGVVRSLAATVDAPPFAYLSGIGSLNEFSKTENGSSFLLKYGFIDYDSRTHSIFFGIRKEDYWAEKKFFGYNREAMNGRIRERLQGYVDDQIEKAGYAQYITCTVNADRSVSWQFDTPPALVSAITSFRDQLRNSLQALFDYELRREYRNCGFVLVGDYIVPDYNQLVQRSLPAVGAAWDALFQAGRGYEERQRIGLLAAFIQEMRYEVPPAVINSRSTCGFYPPLEVLVNGHGDCDSKCAAFAALWRRMTDRPIILISTASHMLVGVGITPMAGQSACRLGNQTYVLCEVAGPAKNYPGYQQSVKGNFEYIAIK